MSKWLNGFLVLIVCFTVNSCNVEQGNESMNLDVEASAELHWGDPLICIVYDSYTGNTERVAGEIKGMIQAKTGIIVDIRNINHYSGPEYVFSLSDYDILILGTPTLGAGEMSPDWDYYLEDFLRAISNNRQFAFFGVGDSGFGADYNKGIKILEEKVMTGIKNAQKLHTTLLVDCNWGSSDFEEEESQEVDKWVTGLIREF